MRGVEGRKYSTGTKGRLKMHADMCRAFIHEQAPGFALAEEFVASIDPGREDAVWQKFQEPSDVGPFLQAWLNGEPEPGATVREVVKAAKVLDRPKSLAPALELAFKKTEAWIASGPAELDALGPRDAARRVLEKLREAL